MGSRALELVRAGPEDAEKVRELTRAAYARWVPVVGREPTPMNVDYALAVVEHEIELLYEDGALVALIETIPLADHLYIESIAIAPDRQGRGLGRRLLAHAEAKARALGVDELRLLTNAMMAANVRLYESDGYEVVSREPVEGIGVRVNMVKRLAGGPPA